MSISAILKESLQVVKKNPILFIPMLALTIITSILSLIFLGSMIPTIGGMAEGPASSSEALTAAGTALGGIFLVLVISSILGLIAHGMTVAMADEAAREEKTSLKSGYTKTKERLVTIIISAVVVGVLVSVGFILLILPGIIAAFLLMFTFIAVMLDSQNAFRAVGKSVRVVTRNFGSVFVLFLVLLAIAVLVGIINVIVGLIPILGAIIAILLSAVYTAYVSVFLVLAYRGLEEKPTEAPEPQT